MPPPAGHAEDVDQAGDAVEDVVPTAHKGDAFRGDPGGSEGAESALKVGDHGDQDVDGDDGERECLKPLGLAQLAPAVLEHHEANAARCGGVELGVVEPTVHMHVSGVVKRPLHAHAGAHVDADEIDGQRGGQRQEAENASGLRAARDLVGQDQAHEYRDPTQPLEHGGLAIYLEQHGQTPFFLSLDEERRPL